MNSVEETTKTPSATKSGISPILKGVGLGLASSIAPQTTSIVRQAFALAKSVSKKEDEEKKKANDLFGLND